MGDSEKYLSCPQFAFICACLTRFTIFIILVLITGHILIILPSAPQRHVTFLFHLPLWASCIHSLQQLIYSAMTSTMTHDSAVVYVEGLYSCTFNPDRKKCRMNWEWRDINYLIWSSSVIGGHHRDSWDKKDTPNMHPLVQGHDHPLNLYFRVRWSLG